MSDWVLIFRVFDRENGEWIRDETKRSFDEEPLKDKQKKFMEKCVTMNWNEPRYNVILTLEKDTKNET